MCTICVDSKDIRRNKVQKVANIDIIPIKNTKDFNLCVNYVLPTKEYKVDPNNVILCKLEGDQIEDLKERIDYYITFFQENLHADLRIIGQLFRRFSYKGFPSLSEINIATNGKDFILLFSKPWEHKDEIDGSILTNKQVIKRIYKELKIINRHLKHNPDSYACIHRKAYFEAWVSFLKKGVGPFIN
jgi:hypothetical protein